MNDNAPPADAADPEDWRAELVGRYTTVSGFLKMLPKVICFGANGEGAAVLAAMEALPAVLEYRSRLAAPLIPAKLIDRRWSTARGSAWCSATPHTPTGAGAAR